MSREGGPLNLPLAGHAFAQRSFLNRDRQSDLRVCIRVVRSLAAARTMREDSSTEQRRACSGVLRKLGSWSAATTLATRACSSAAWLHGACPPTTAAPATFKTCDWSLTNGNDPQAGPKAMRDRKRTELGSILARRAEHPLKKLVGATRFELATPCTPCKCATRLRHAPTETANDSPIGLQVLECGIYHGLRRAPCIRSLAEPTRLTRNTQTGSYRRRILISSSSSKRI